MQYGHGHSAKVLLHFAIEYEGAAAIQNGAEAMIGFGEKGGFHKTGFVFESQKLHGIAVLCMHDLARDQQTGNAHMPA